MEPHWEGQKEYLTGKKQVKMKTKVSHCVENAWVTFIIIVCDPKHHVRRRKRKNTISPPYPSPLDLLIYFDLIGNNSAQSAQSNAPRTRWQNIICRAAVIYNGSKIRTIRRRALHNDPPPPPPHHHHVATHPCITNSRWQHCHKRSCLLEVYLTLFSSRMQVQRTSLLVSNYVENGSPLKLALQYSALMRRYFFKYHSPIFPSF